MHRLILFDIDETMIASDGAGRRALTKALETLLPDHRQPLKDTAQTLPMSGKTDPQIIREILQALEFTPAEIEHYRPEIIKSYLQYLEPEIKACQHYIMHEGVEPLLNSLELEPNAYLGVLTGNVKEGACKKLAPFNLTRFFPIGAWGCDSSNRLELPPIAVSRANAFFARQFAPEEVMIIGDSVNDIACAKAYGAKSLAVNTGKTSFDQLSAENPSYLFSSLGDKNAILEAIFAD
jgi:phosphoglycolate phosphatase-like HAD superfamily hydrolase